MSNFARKARRRRMLADRPYCNCGKPMIHRAINTGRGRRRYWICRCGNVRPIGKKPADAADLEELGRQAEELRLRARELEAEQASKLNRSAAELEQLAEKGGSDGTPEG